eukprot:7419182-Pyramimonas_sp.AAC.1
MNPEEEPEQDTPEASEGSLPPKKPKKEKASAPPLAEHSSRPQGAPAGQSDQNGEPAGSGSKLYAAVRRLRGALGDPTSGASSLGEVEFVDSALVRSIVETGPAAEEHFYDRCWKYVLIDYT